MKERIPELDALRGIAAIAVVFFHVFAYAPGYKWTAIGVTGVDLFFIISGFVIFMSIQNVSSAREFVVNRFARLYPVYWACVTITFSLFLIQQLKIFHVKFSVDLFGIYAVNMTMLQNYFGIKSVDGSYWTLLVELQFYAFIVVLYLLKLLGHIEKIGAAMLLGIATCTFLIHGNPVINSNIASYAPLLNHFALFFAGIIFYKLYFKLIDKYSALAILLACFALHLYVFDHVGTDFVFISRYKFVFALSAYFVCFVLLVNRNLSFIRNKVFLFLGKISYPLYVIHQFLCTFFLMPLLYKRLHLPAGLAGGISIIIVITLATLINRYIEVPYRSKLKKYFAKMQRPALQTIAIHPESRA